MSDVEDDPQPSTSMVRGRKRARNTTQWKKNVAKQKRVSGEQYISVSTSCVVDARKVGPPCKDGCFVKIGGAEVVKVIFNDFWALKDQDKQNTHINKLVQATGFVHQRKDADASRKKRRINYHVYYDKKLLPVCRVAFLHIHGISEKRVRVALSKLTMTGTTEIDQRGRHEPANKITERRRQLVTEHINSLPTVSSHYSRSKSPFRKFLGSEFRSQKALHELYVAWLSEKYPDEQPVEEGWYLNYFRKNFNIGFTPPQSDICNTCERLEQEMKSLDRVRDASAIRKLQLELEHHKKKAEAAGSMSQQDNDDDDAMIVLKEDDMDFVKEEIEVNEDPEFEGSAGEISSVPNPLRTPIRKQPDLRNAIETSSSGDPLALKDKGTTSMEPNHVQDPKGKSPQAASSPPILHVLSEHPPETVPPPPPASRVSPNSVVCREEDEEDMYGKYIATAMRTLSRRSRGLAKLRIQQVIFELKEEDSMTQSQ